MRSFIFFLLSLLVISYFPQVVRADDGNMIYYYTKSSMTPTKISLDDLDKLIFSSDGIQIWSYTRGVDNILFNDFLLFTFTEIEHPFVMAVEPIYMMSDLHMRYDVDNRKLFIESGYLLGGVGVYDLQGRMIYNETSSATNYCITLPALPKAVYVIKTQCNGKIIVNKIVL